MPKKDVVDRTTLEPIPVEDIKQLKYGDEVYCEDLKGRIVRLKINGKPRVWKTRPNDVKVPWKYGQYEFGYAGWIENPYVGPLKGYQIGPVLLRTINK